FAVVEEAVRPPEIGTLDGAKHRLRRSLGILFRRESARPQLVQRVAAVHHDVQSVPIPRDRGHLPKPGSVTNSILLLLAEFVLVEFPDAAVLFENRARVLSRRFRLAVACLAGIRRRADVDIKAAFAVKGDAFVAMLSDSGQPGDDDLRIARWLQL